MGYKPKRMKNRKLYILQGLPEIGPKRAKALLHHFGSVEAVMTATAEDLKKVEGIGPSIAEKIREVLEDEGREGKGKPSI